ncbi:MAG: dihydrolipoyl dehydrogenase [Bacteriovoracaceae bacterium]|jgi:dihydrolipoamide dehydrogenase|nr:dihydrolipoyl dehydrogenase [Bacteriovoracaceae bacterium]
MKKKQTKILIILLILILLAVVKIFNLQSYLSLDYFQQNLDSIRSFYAQNQILTIGSYALIYIVSTALSLPGATVLTLVGGAIFGFVTGTIIVSFASTIGATLAFLVARLVLRDFVEKKFASKINSINKGIEKEGAFYLFSLRLVPLFPFFLVNLVMGLTKIKTHTYFFVSQIGMILGTMAYVNAGLQLSKLKSISGILSPSILLSFTVLGLIPIISKKIVDKFKANSVYKKFKKPEVFDYNIVAIGGGAAGLVTSYIGAAVKARVALIEKDKMGGDCLNTGCVPSKAIIKSAKILHMAKKANELGLTSTEIEFDFKNVMNRVQKVIEKIEPHDSVERYSSLGVECFSGEAKIISPWEVEVNGQIIKTKNIVVATGASPFVPPIPGIEKADVLTSENLWKLEELPKRLIVLGGGPIGLEMAQTFNRLGSSVSVVEMAPLLLAREDEEVSEFVKNKLEKEGVNILTTHKAIKFKGNRLTCSSAIGEVIIEFDKVLVAVGRKANTKGFGLEELGVELRRNGTIEANEYLQTNYPNIYACGDVTGPYQLTHVAAHQAWYTSVNALFGAVKKFKVDYQTIPWCTYLDPEVATVGVNERAAKEQGLSYEVTKYGIDDLDRAICEGEAAGFVKVITKTGSDRILGATIVGYNAGELLSEFTFAMKHGLGLNKILGTIHPYPTMSEANKYLAGVYKQNRKPEKLLRFIEKFHSYVRGEKVWTSTKKFKSTTEKN